MPSQPSTADRDLRQSGAGARLHHPHEHSGVHLSVSDAPASRTSPRWSWSTCPIGCASSSSRSSSTSGRFATAAAFTRRSPTRSSSTWPTAIAPRFMRLTARFNVRGGIYTSVIAERRAPQLAAPADRSICPEQRQTPAARLQSFLRLYSPLRVGIIARSLNDRRPVRSEAMPGKKPGSKTSKAKKAAQRRRPRRAGRAEPRREPRRAAAGEPQAGRQAGGRKPRTGQRRSPRKPAATCERTRAAARAPVISTVASARAGQRRGRRQPPRVRACCRSRGSRRRRRRCRDQQPSGRPAQRQAVRRQARRAVHEQAAAGALPADPAQLEARSDGGSRSHGLAHEGRGRQLSRSRTTAPPRKRNSAWNCAPATASAS